MRPTRYLGRSPRSPHPGSMLPSILLRVLVFGEITRVASPLRPSFPVCAFSPWAAGFGAPPLVSPLARGSPVHPSGWPSPVPSANRYLLLKPNSFLRKARRWRMAEGSSTDEYILRIGLSVQSGDEEAIRAAEELAGCLMSGSPPGAGAPASPSAELVTVCEGEACERSTIRFGAGGRVELLRGGECAGEGLSSELPEVLARICTPENLAKDPLIKALGRGRAGLSVVDATAGFGHDGLRMAAAGHRVTALERDPVMHAFLRDGLRRLANDAATAALWEGRVSGAGGAIEARLADAEDWCAPAPAPPCAQHRGGARCPWAGVLCAVGRWRAAAARAAVARAG